MLPVDIPELMSESVETVSPERPAGEAAVLLGDENIGSLVVENGEPVGIITESDIASLVANEADPENLTAADCMSTPLQTISTTEGPERAVELFREHDIKRLPVLDGDQTLAGIVTTTDISYYLPHISRKQNGTPEPDNHQYRERVDTAYENEDWEFESLGKHHDRIDVGDVVWFSKTLSNADVEAFADASGDTNRLHLDPDYADGTRFGQSIVHGTLVGGVISAALARLPGLTVYISQNMSYLGPVQIGDRVTAICEIVDKIGDNRYRLTTTVETEDGDEVIEGEAVVMADPIPETA